MIKAENIGRRIRTLRKQKHISQERMALDLGLYQADISNIERATGNSGVTDIVKLDMIANYLDVSLTDLLSDEALPSPASVTSTNIKLKEYEPNQYKLMGAYFENDIFSSISEVKLEAPTGKMHYVSFIDIDDKIYFFQTKSSMFSNLHDNSDDPLYIEKHIKYCFLSGDDYNDIFSKADKRWVDICRFLIFIAKESEQQAKELIQISLGKRFCEMSIPKPTNEPEELVDIDWTDLSTIYRYRLMIETDIKNPSIYSDLDNQAKREKETLKKLKAACVYEEAYKLWKKDLIDAKIESVMQRETIVVCDYIVAGYGQYKAIMPEDQVEGFKCWINGNGSAFFCGVRPATKHDIRTYAAQHLTEDLW